MVDAGHRQGAAEQPEERGALHHDVDVRRGAREPQRARELRPLPQRARPARLQRQLTEATRQLERRVAERAAARQVSAQTRCKLARAFPAVGTRL